MSFLSGANALIGLAVVAGLFFVVTRFGQEFGAGAKGISEGVSSLLSPKIVPTIGFETVAPQWLEDILGSTRLEDRPLSPVEPSPIRTPEGTIDPFWLIPGSGLLPQIPGVTTPRPEDRTTNGTVTPTPEVRTEDRTTYPSEIQKIIGRVDPYGRY